jgi:hypothetical protein
MNNDNKVNEGRKYYFEMLPGRGHKYPDSILSMLLGIKVMYTMSISS